MDDASEGARRRRRAQGVAADKLDGLLRDIDPGVAGWADDFVFGQVWGRPGLTQDERMLVAVSALAAGGHHGHLRNYLHGALQAGVPPRKLHETLVMLVVYCGFPGTVTALHEWRKVLEVERRAGRVPAARPGEVP